MIRRPPRSPLFPSTPLSRSRVGPPAHQPQQRLDVRRVRTRVPPHLGLVLRELQGHGGRKTQALAQERSEEHTSELQSQSNLVCRLLLEKKKKKKNKRQSRHK